MAGATPEYPDDSIQSVVGLWWTDHAGHEPQRGCLIRAFVPHVDQQPLKLNVKGRSDPTAHGAADYEVEPLRIKAPFKAPDLPVAAMPDTPGELRIVQRGKIRPMLVISTGGVGVDRVLRQGTARWMSNPTLLAAPYYGADQDGSRGGWRPEFVKRIRHCEYPQYMWDSLPNGRVRESILRLDHIQPIGRHTDTYELTGYRLTDEALKLLDEWLMWLQTGVLDAAGVLSMLRKDLPSLG